MNIPQHASQQVQYHALARALHWSMAVGFIFMWGCGYAMTSVVAEDSQAEELLFSLHISIGVILLLLLMLRIGTRLLVMPPPLSGELSNLEQIGAKIAHLALYVLPLAIIAVGWAETDFGGHGVSLFGLPMPKVFPTTESFAGINLEEATEEIHELLAWSMLAITLLHIAAVVKHQWIDKQDILARMGAGKQSERA